MTLEKIIKTTEFKVIVIALLPLLAPIDAPAWSQTTNTEASVEAQGKKLLERDCATCHAVGFTDKSAHAQAPNFRDLSLRYPVESLAEALAEGIMTGHPDMPVFEYPADEVEQIIAYLESIQAK